MFAIKTEISNQHADAWTFVAQKTMYGGKRIGVGDEVFVFASENEGGLGLVARGVVTAAQAVPKRLGIERQTPRVDVVVERHAQAMKALGRAELRRFDDWLDGQPQTELNFKLYRQATNKVIGLSPQAAQFLRTYF